jgi:hypothetical protein
VTPIDPIIQRVRTDRTAKKVEVGSVWTHEPLTPELIAKHLSGGPARGCCPIKAGESTTMVAVFDLDSHKGETAWPQMQAAARSLCLALQRVGLEPQAFRSSGGRGVHIILMWAEPQDAYSVRTYLRSILAAEGFRDGTAGVAKGEIEVFPKQDSVPADGCGSMFILPLAGKSIALDTDMEPADDFTADDWRNSEPVPQQERPARPAAGPTAAATRADLLSALGSLNGATASLSYEDWRNGIFAIHHEMGDDGYALASEWSAKSPKHNEDFLRDRVWPYVRPGGGITGKTVIKMAMAAGWQNPAKAPRATGSEPAQPGGGVGLTDFYAYMPMHQYIFTPTRELWPASSVNGRVPWPEVNGKKIAPASWLDQHRPVEQMAWHPAEPEVIVDRVLQVSGWIRHTGVSVLNLYRPPARPQGNASQAGPWIEHVHRVYPEDAEHLIRWMAHRVQQPGDKVNHAIVLGGAPGIGKDTMLEPLKAAVGAWNWSDISPAQMLQRFNGWLRAVVIRINEARDLGEVDRFAFFDHCKVITAAPPDALRVDEKHLRETYVVNCCGVIITTNHLGDGLYLPADDRRHYVAWSPRQRDDFSADYWTKLYTWFASGGIGHVCAYLAEFDLTDFDAKAPPPKTAAFWQIVAAGESPESGELRDVIDALKNPDAMVLQSLIDEAEAKGMQSLAHELQDRKSRRALPHKLERVGYVPVRNPDADDGLFKLRQRRQAVYAKRGLTLAAQVRAARELT